MNGSQDSRKKGTNVRKPSVKMDWKEECSVKLLILAVNNSSSSAFPSYISGVHRFG